MKLEQPSMGRLTGSLEPCISPNRSFSSGCCLQSWPQDQHSGLAAFPARELLICQGSACSAWLLALQVWNKTCEVLSHISRSCRGWELPLHADTESCQIAVPVSSSQRGLLLHILVVLEEIPSCMLYNTARICRACVLVSLGVWAYSQTFPVCILGMLLGWRADLGASHLPWIIPMEKWLPCSPCRSQRLLLQPQRGQRCSHAQWWATQAVVLTRCHGLFWLTLVTTCHCLFNGFWKLAYLKCSVSFSFLKGCVILWCSSLHQLPTPLTPGRLTHRDVLLHRPGLMQLLLWDGDLPALAPAQDCVFLISLEGWLL